MIKIVNLSQSSSLSNSKDNYRKISRKVKCNLQSSSNNHKESKNSNNNNNNNHKLKKISSFQIHSQNTIYLLNRIPNLIRNI